MAMTAQELAPPQRTPHSPSFQPDYPDEVSGEQLEAIRQMTDPDGSRARGRTVIHSPAW